MIAPGPMMTPDKVALILLAAGLSCRFGNRDKLLHPLHGLPVGLHLPATVQAVPFGQKLTVTGTGSPLDFARYGFTPVINPDPATGMGQSIALGMQTAWASLPAPDAVLICLADMPFVTAAHLQAMCQQFDPHDPGCIIASCITGTTSPMPPALFGPAHFPALAALSGDRGARHLMNRARLVPAPATQLQDIDKPGDADAATLHQPPIAL